MMRIVTGTKKGVRLQTLEGDATRPTSERVKEAMFSSIQFDLEGRKVLDLFAGSGQLGLEALSRGATSCTFIDASSEAMNVVKENAKKTDFFGCSHFLISDYRSYIRKIGEPFSLIFLDPPYAMHCVEDALYRLDAAHAMLPGCLVVCETGEEELFHEHPELVEHFDILKKARYSISYVTILSYKGASL